MLRLVSKTGLLTVRLKPQVLRDFKIAAEVQGASMSGLVHMFVIRTIREQKETIPKAFERHGDLERPVLTAKVKRPRSKERRAR